jgi:hypothetical protein
MSNEISLHFHFFNLILALSRTRSSMPSTASPPPIRCVGCARSPPHTFPLLLPLPRLAAAATTTYLPVALMPAVALMPVPVVALRVPVAVSICGRRRGSVRGRAPRCCERRSWRARYGMGHFIVRVIRLCVPVSYFGRGLLHSSHARRCDISSGIFILHYCLFRAMIQ